MVKRSLSYSQFKKTYLFSEMGHKIQRYKEMHPEAKVINLGVGDTVLPIAPSIALAMERAANGMGTNDYYQGYIEGEGLYELREKIAEVYYGKRFSPEEIFISDGAKTDLARLPIFLGRNLNIGIQDPTYPAYFDALSLLGDYRITRIPCLLKHGFFPQINDLSSIDMLYICNPNNPTAIPYSAKELKELILFAKRHQAFIIYDAVYSGYIQDKSFPCSIYDVEGAKDVAIEINSLSKTAGFSGLRLGWTVVPKQLHFACKNQVLKDYRRFLAATFNGVSVLSQKGALAAFEKEGQKEVKKFILSYLSCARQLKGAFTQLGYQVYGGEHAPYLWVHAPKQPLWEAFEYFLKEKQLIVTPGIGFGPSGKDFFRVSAFLKEEQLSGVLARLSSQKHLLFNL